jgi:hypothetical protein
MSASLPGSSEPLAFSSKGRASESIAATGPAVRSTGALPGAPAFDAPARAD